MRTNWTKYWRAYTYLEKLWIWRITRAYKELLKNIKLKDVKILELGSGSGINSLTLAKIFNAKEITLVDSNKKAIEISKNKFKNSNLSVRFLKRDINNLNLKEGFDIVHSEGLIEHFYGKKRIEIFKKHVDFCKKGGIIIIFVPYKCIHYNLSRKILEKLNMWMWNEKPFSREELRILSRQFNLKILNEYSSPLIHQFGILLKN
jgi:ubiquinone/menaquinone biosynthesis C-methylase UbiE